MNQGWIGTWSPGIGDPTLVGWVTVGLYAWATWACLQVLQSERRQQLLLNSNERIIWRLLVAGMIALGVNKQLDFQSALTELARLHAYEHGWYANRRQFQQAFVATVPILGLTALAVLSVLARHAPAQTLLTCGGAAGLMVFVVIRAASFHHVDEMMGWHLAGLRINWIIEMGPLVVIGVGARRRISVRT
jgi:hypothetical protein